jgi:hypothetical protein
VVELGADATGLFRPVVVGSWSLPPCLPH